jgi:hypothetical protein
MACNLKFKRFVRHWIILPMAYDLKFKLQLFIYSRHCLMGPRIIGLIG